MAIIKILGSALYYIAWKLLHYEVLLHVLGTYFMKRSYQDFSGSLHYQDLYAE